MHYDEILCRSSPGTAHRTPRIARHDIQSPPSSSYTQGRRSSCQDGTSTSDSLQNQPLVAKFPASGAITIIPEQKPTTFLADPASPLSKADPVSESKARKIVGNDDSVNSRSGKRWKAAHRAVERRYRSNLNLKIIKLGQCIPAIRSQIVGIDELESAEDCRTVPKSKVQKGHVLSKAIDYIQTLQQLVARLEAEKQQLENKVESLHMMVGGDYLAPLRMTQCNQAPEVPRRSSGPQTSVGSRSTKWLSVGLKDQMKAEAEAQTPISPQQNAFSFVSEYPSLVLKQPKVAKPVFSKLAPG